MAAPGSAPIGERAWLATGANGSAADLFDEHAASMVASSREYLEAILFVLSVTEGRMMFLRSMALA